MKALFENIRSFVKKYERHISSCALLGGFILDSLTLRRIDFFLRNLVIFSYLLIAGTGIVLSNLHASRAWKGKVIDKLYPFFPIIIQFAFGGLFSSFLVFYSRSASYVASWPFLVLLVGLLIGNELFKKFYLKLTFQVTVFFFVLYSYLIFLVPMVPGRMGDIIFVLSGIISLILIILFFYVFSRFIPPQFTYSKKYIVLSVGGIFVLVNVFYFTNILPPIPLAIKEVGAYHHVARSSEGYKVQDEIDTIKTFFKKTKILHIAPGESVYIYSAIFAPTSLNTSVVHHWEYYHEQQKKWVTSSKINFPIVGGRDGGYRGYTFKSNVFTGLWRVNIETTRGQLIGRVKFRVERVDTKVPLESELLSNNL